MNIPAKQFSIAKNYLTNHHQTDWRDLYFVDAHQYYPLKPFLITARQAKKHEMRTPSVSLTHSFSIHLFFIEAETKIEKDI